MSAPAALQPRIPSRPGEPTWEVARFAPEQGRWTEEAYLRLPTNNLVERVDGRLEFPPMPSDLHQVIVMRLCDLLRDHARDIGLSAAVRFAGLPMRTPNGNREPDVLFLRDENDPRRQARLWDGADLVMEVVSPDDPNRDYVDKRSDYAAAGIPEYWIVDPRPRSRTITVLVLDHARYREQGVFGRGETATGVLLPGLAAEVSGTLAA